MSVHAQISIMPIEDSEQGKHPEPAYLKVRGNTIIFELPTRSISFRWEELEGRHLLAVAMLVLNLARNAKAPSKS